MVRGSPALNSLSIFQRVVCGLDKPTEVFNSFSAARLGVRHECSLTVHHKDTKPQSY